MTEQTRVRELPEYRAVLAVDIKNFSGVKAADHHELTESIPEILAAAFRRAGYTDIWSQARFAAGRGDGYVVGFRPEVLPILIGPVLDGLQEELAERRASPKGLASGGPRLRVAIDVGPLTEIEGGKFGDGSGQAMVDVHRLLDSEPLRRALDESDPEVTLVAAMLSARVHDDVVAAGYSAQPASAFIPAEARVKTYQATGYLYVPVPSGALLASGMNPPAPPAATVPEPAYGSVTNAVSGNVGGNVVQLQDVHGPLTVAYTEHRREP